MSSNSQISVGTTVDLGDLEVPMVKGGTLVGTGADNPSVLPVDADTFVYTADTTEGTGIKWAAAAVQLFTDNATELHPTTTTRGVIVGAATAGAATHVLAADGSKIQRLTTNVAALNITSSGRTTANGIDIAETNNAITSASLLSISEVGSAVTAARTGSQVSITSERETNGATVSDNFDNVSIFRESAETSGTLTVTGALLKIENSVDANTTDTSILLELVQDAQSTGDLINAESAGTKRFILNSSGDTVISGAAALGVADQSTTAVAGQTLRAVDMVGGTTSDAAGADLTIAAGLGTGTGDAGIIDFQLPIVVGAGSSIQTRASRLTLDMVGSTSELTMNAAQAMTISTTTGDLTLAPGGDFDVVIPDGSNVASGLALGTGSDSRLYYNGTDSFWDLQAAGTGDLMIASGVGFPSPDPGQVHIWRATAGAVTALSTALLTLENSSNTYLQLLGGNTSVTGILFGSSTSSTRGFIEYGAAGHPTEPDQFLININGAARIHIAQTSMEFQQAESITTTAGDLTLAPAADVIVSSDFSHTGTNFGIFGTIPTTQPAAYTRNATIVEDRTLRASASATILNNNNVLAALIADLQSLGVVA